MDKKQFGTFGILKKMTQEQIEKWSQELPILLKETIKNEAISIEEYVNHLRTLNPNITNDALAKKIISRRSLKSGGIGAICGLGGIITLPVTMPADIYYSFKIQARMVLSLAFIYGWNIEDDETVTDILLVMGGNAGINALKNAGIKVGEEFAKKGVEKYVTREVMKKINKTISRKIITKAGEKSFTSFAKLIPLVGAPIGGTFDYVGTRSIGETALKFYSG